MCGACAGVLAALLDLLTQDAGRHRQLHVHTAVPPVLYRPAALRKLQQLLVRFLTCLLILLEVLPEDCSPFCHCA